MLGNITGRFGLVLLILVGFAFAPIDRTVKAKSPSQQAMMLVASLEVFTEGVEVKRAETEEWFPVTGRSPLIAGDRIRTDETGQAIVTWFNTETFLALLPSTEVAIDDFSLTSNEETEVPNYNINVSLVLGRAINSVQQLGETTAQYTVKTSALSAVVEYALAGLSGDEKSSMRLGVSAFAKRQIEENITLFVIDVDADETTSLVVEDGKVAAIQGDFEHSVPAGFWLQNQADDPLEEPFGFREEDELAAIEDAVVLEMIDQITSFDLEMMSGDESAATEIPELTCLLSPEQNTGVNIRRAPSTQAEILTNLRPGETIRANALVTQREAWYVVVVGEEIGFIAARVVTGSADCEQLEQVTLDTLSESDNVTDATPAPEATSEGQDDRNDDDEREDDDDDNRAEDS